MKIDRLEQIVAAYGGAPNRWPSDERHEAMALLARAPEAASLLEGELKLDFLLDQSMEGDLDPALVTQILGAAAQSHEASFLLESEKQSVPLRVPRIRWSTDNFLSSIDAIDWSWKSIMQPATLLGCVALLGLTTGIFATEAFEQAVYASDIEEGFWQVAFDDSDFSLEESLVRGDMK